MSSEINNDWAADVVGWKRCWLLSSLDSGHLVFAGIRSLPRYGITGVAQCQHGYGHAAPTPSCTCGFSACSSIPDLDRIEGPWRHGLVEVQVELMGKVVRDPDGTIRASHQRVIGCRVHPWCYLCGGPATHLVHSSHWQTLVSVCGSCAAHNEAAGPLTIENAQTRLGCEVVVGAARRSLQAGWYPPTLMGANHHHGVGSVAPSLDDDEWAPRVASSAWLSSAQSDDPN